MTLVLSRRLHFLIRKGLFPPPLLSQSLSLSAPFPYQKRITPATSTISVTLSLGASILLSEKDLSRRLHYISPSQNLTLGDSISTLPLLASLAIFFPQAFPLKSIVSRVSIHPSIPSRTVHSHPSPFASPSAPSSHALSLHSIHTRERLTRPIPLCSPHFFFWTFLLFFSLLCPHPSSCACC
jgi:hypothetical protein